MPQAKFKEWKTDTDGNFVRVSGNPVAVMEDGTELPHDFIENHVKPLGAANREAAERRARIDELESALEPWNSLEMTPEQIKAATSELDKLKKAAKAASNGGDGGDGSGVDPAKVAEITEELEQARAKVEGLESQLKELSGERDSALSTVHNLTVGAAIRNSKFFAGKDGNLPLSMQHPDVATRDLADYGEPGKDGSVVWYTGPKTDKERRVIRGHDGEPASTDEALEALGPKLGWWKDLLRGKGSKGSGAAGGSGAGYSSDIPRTAQELKRLNYDERAKVREALKAKHGEDGWEAAWQRILMTEE